jgi:hypothetical protein
MFRVFLTVCLALMISISGAWTASPGLNATDTVKRLYQDYSWEATMIGGPGPWIGDAPKTVLDQYFDSDLAAVWLKSRTCGGDCAVDWIGYDPLWDSMDPSGFSNVSIDGTNDPRIVKVEMNGPCVPGQSCKPEGSGRVGLTYFLKPTALGWRISDIQSDVHGSLKAALLKALSEH